MFTRAGCEVQAISTIDEPKEYVDLVVDFAHTQHRYVPIDAIPRWVICYLACDMYRGFFFFFSRLNSGRQCARLNIILVLEMLSRLSYAPR